jgi:hypothetical protein
MRIPKRFTLSALFLMMTVTAVIFGYSQYRRRWLTAEVKQLASEIDPSYEGYAARPLQLNDHWFWPTAPKRFLLMIEQYRGHYVLRGVKVSRSEVQAYFESMGDRLRSIGVGTVQYGVYVVPKDKSEKVWITIGDAFDDLNLED